jgi:hypothetical protein
MSDVIVFKGAVSFPITLDPSVWIFDDRKIDLRTYKGEADQAGSTQTDYLKGTGAQWDKEMMEGATPPSERRSLVEERKALEGDYGMRLAPFIENAKPHPDATHVIIHRHGGDIITLTLQQAKQAILQFSKNGKPIRENGPVHLYLPETWLSGGEPIHSIQSLEFVTIK